MASGKLLRQLIKAGLEGDQDRFRAASTEVIAEERGKNHHLLAQDLERLLYAEYTPSKDSTSRNGKTLQLVASLPVSKDSGLPLVEHRPVVRDERDLVLSDSTRSSIEDVLQEHNRSDLLAAYGLQPARKLLFFGPPGCGKSLAAEVMANSLSLPLIVVRLDSLISSFLGETAANLRKVFDYFTHNTVVGLFDEVDALAKDRGDSADHGELKRSVNAVLQMMDGYRGSSILIATTNYETLLDKAVWRRFDEAIRFEMPNTEQIKRLLTVKLSGVRQNFEPNDTGVASLFKGLSHADIERVLRRAVKDMVLAGREFLERSNLEVALSKEHRLNH
jgi:SpoVK/Ycf46/Vps4 family AAA+-type ATPase